MCEVTVILKDETKRSELVALLSTLPYVAAVQFGEASHEAARRKIEQPQPKNDRAVIAPEYETTGTSSLADPLDREVALFEEQHEQLVKTFLGQYIAMYQGKVIAHHPELDTLITNVHASHPNAPVLFRQVQETLPPILHLRSPRMVKH